MPFTVLHEELDKVEQVAKAKGVQVVTDKEVNLATKTAVETSIALSKEQTDSDKRSRKLRKW